MYITRECFVSFPASWAVSEEPERAMTSILFQCPISEVRTCYCSGQGGLIGVVLCWTTGPRHVSSSGEGKNPGKQKELRKSLLSRYSLKAGNKEEILEGSSTKGNRNISWTTRLFNRLNQPWCLDVRCAYLACSTSNFRICRIFFWFASLPLWLLLWYAISAGVPYMYDSIGYREY